jgi:hypothetical protein
METNFGSVKPVPPPHESQYFNNLVSVDRQKKVDGIFQKVLFPILGAVSVGLIGWLLLGGH